MTDQEKLTESLGLAFENIRALHATLAAVMTDVTALRHVVMSKNCPFSVAVRLASTSSNFSFL